CDSVSQRRGVPGDTHPRHTRERQKRTVILEVIDRKMILPDQGHRTISPPMVRLVRGSRQTVHVRVLMPFYLVQEEKFWIIDGKLLYIPLRVVSHVLMYAVIKWSGITS